MKRIALLLAALLLLSALAACSSEPERLRLADLASFADRYDGSVVVTEGTVRAHDEPAHSWIEDEALNRVRIVPGSAIEARVGERVRVQGVFRYSAEAGRRIEADQVTVVTP
jgi:hypothetical protein